MDGVERLPNVPSYRWYPWHIPLLETCNCKYLWSEWKRNDKTIDTVFDNCKQQQMWGGITIHEYLKKCIHIYWYIFLVSGIFFRATIMSYYTIPVWVFCTTHTCSFLVVLYVLQRSVSLHCFFVCFFLLDSLTTRFKDTFPL